MKFDKENTSREKIEFICPYCGHNESYFSKCEFFELGQCVNCKKVTFRTQLKENPNKFIRCPYCNSLEVIKISSLSRIGGVAVLGLATGKLGKQWHCNKCKSNF